MQRACISKKTFYTHFSQKEELIEAVLTAHNEKQLKKQEVKLKPSQMEGNAIDQLMEASAFHSSPKSDKFVNFFYDLNKYYPEIHNKITQHNQKHIREKIRENILTGIDENLFRSDFDMELMIRFLTVQFVTIIDLTSKDFGKSAIHRGMALVMDVYVRVLCNRQGLDYYEHMVSIKTLEKKDEEPMKDEELDLIIDQMMDDPDGFKKVAKDQMKQKQAGIK